MLKLCVEANCGCHGYNLLFPKLFLEILGNNLVRFDKQLQAICQSGIPSFTKLMSILLLVTLFLGCEFVGTVAVSPTTVSHNGHTFIFHQTERVSWDEAIRLCESKGSRLAEIYDYETYTVLRNNLINSSTQFFCSGANRSSRSWDSRGSASDIPDWAEGEADGIQLNMLALSTFGWEDVQSSDQLPYICEMANLTSIRLSVTQITIGLDDVVQTVCTADGVPSSNVFWKFSATAVTYDSNNTVYQTKNDGRSVLHVANAVLTDEGIYTCFAENRAGNFYKTLNNDFNLTVPSFPEFVTVEPEGCSPRITVRWKPSSRASNIPHRIVIWNVKNKRERYVFSKSRKTISDNFTLDVKKWMFYRVEVKPNPIGAYANRYRKNNRTSSPTMGRPGRASYLQVDLLNKYSCSIKWRRPNDLTAKYIKNYKVITKKKPNSPPGLNAAKIRKTVDKKQMSYFTEEKANMRYEFGIQAETCAGAGDIVWSQKICVTDRKAPDKVEKPELSANTVIDGTVKLTIDIPSQQNGPISCVFVIVKVRETSDNLSTEEHMRNYAIDDLIRSNNLTSTTEYIALALGIESLDRNNKGTLGDERITICEVSPTLKRSKRSVNSNVFVGRNLKLDSSKSNSIRIVVALSNYDEILVAASESVVISPTNQGLGGNIFWIIGATVGSITLLLLISIGVYVKKKSQNASSSGAVVQGKPATTRFDGTIPHDGKAQTYEAIHQRTIQAKSKISGRYKAEPSYSECIPHRPSNKNSTYEVVGVENTTDQTNAETAYAPYVLQLQERPDGYDAINIVARQDESQNAYFKIKESVYEPIHVA